MAMTNPGRNNSFANRRWWPALAGGAALGAAAVIGGFGLEARPANADENKPVENKPEFKPEDVRVGAPPELEALRKAVENASKKGENVDDIRKHLDELEKALAGKAWVRPQPPAENARPDRNAQNPQVPAFPAFPAFPAPNGGLNAEANRKAQEMLRRAQENFRGNPQDFGAIQNMMDEQQRLIREAMLGMAGGGRIGVMPDMPAIGGRAFARPNDGRLGVRLEKVPLVVLDQLDLPAGRGLIANEVVPGSAAEKAGVKASDIFLEFAGSPVTDDMADLVKRVQDAKTGEKLDLVVLRKGKKETLKVELPEPRKLDGIQADAAPLNRPGLAGGGQNTVRISVVNGQVEIHATENGVAYTVKGAMEEGKAVPTEIAIEDGDKNVKVDSIEKVPAEYKAKIESLMKKFPAGRRLKPID